LILSTHFTDRAGDTYGSFTTRICPDNIHAMIDRGGTHFAGCNEIGFSEATMTASPAQLATAPPSFAGSDRPNLSKRDTSVTQVDGNARVAGSRNIHVLWPVFVLCLGGILSLTWSVTLAGLVWLAVRKMLF
jgi:hypothetical protein